MNANQPAAMRLIINGKSAGDPALREAIRQLRERGQPIEVRVTWEGGDAARLAGDAVKDGIDIVIAGGGDGTINEVVNGILVADETPSITLGIVPYGTANDFATSCGIPIGDPLAALTLLTQHKPTSIDVGKVNDRYFINVASGGFGADVTVATPPQMKKALGGAAYSLMGLVTAAKMSPYRGTLTTRDGEETGQMVIMAVGNGRQAGGGFQVCSKALLNDGLLDVLVVSDVPVLELGVLLNELLSLDAPSNKYVSYRQLPWFRIETETELTINLDGEPIRGRKFCFEALAGRLPVIIPPDSPMIRRP